MSIPQYRLNSGFDIPAIGFGTMQIPKEKMVETLRIALESGYRLYDGAEAYNNEKEIGEAFKIIFAEGKYKREDLFYTSKLFNTHHKTKDVALACRNTLQNLQFSYLDLYLVHSPIAIVEGATKDDRPVLERTPMFETWKAMELLVKDGLVKSIGVSNFSVPILNDLLSYAEIPPATNQIEVHPFNQRTLLIDFCHQHNIHVTSYFPTARYGIRKTDPQANPKPAPSVLTTPLLLDLAKKYNKTPSQIALKWNIERKVKEGYGNTGKYVHPAVHYRVSIIPRSANPAHIRENIALLDFSLADDELEAIETLDQGYFLNAPSRAFGFFPLWS